MGEKLTLQRRRRVLGVLGGAVAGWMSTGMSVAESTDGQPTVAASSPDCETLALAYTQGQPAVEVSLDGPVNRTKTLETGATRALSVPAGTYEISARLAAASPNGQSNRAVRVTGSPVKVADCGLAADVYCIDATTVGFDITNTLDRCVKLNWEQYNETTDQYPRRGHSILQPGEPQHLALYLERGLYRIWVETGEKPVDGRCPREFSERIPINGEDPLVVEETHCT